MRSFLLSVLGALVLCSCTSPLDVDTRRIDTRRTNRLVTVSLNVKVLLAPQDTFAIPFWLYAIDRSTLTTDTPIAGLMSSDTRLSMEYVLRTMNFAPARNKALKGLSVRLDSMPLSGHFSILGDPATGTGVSVVTAFRDVDTVFAAECTLAPSSTTDWVSGSMLITTSWERTSRAQIIMDFIARAE